MGVCINYSLGQQKELVKKSLDEAQKFAEIVARENAVPNNIEMVITRHSDNKLFIDIGNCETLAFDFRTWEEFLEEKANDKQDWTYETATLKDRFAKEVLENKSIMFSSQFTKTQFGTINEHKWVAEIIRIVAMKCMYVAVYDEGDYYHTGNIQDADEAIKENGKLIDSVAGMLKEQGFEEKNIIKGSDL